MNLIVLTEGDFVLPDEVVLYERRFDHIRNILNVHIGDRLRVGKLNGRMGYAMVLSMETCSVRLQVILDGEPPKPAQCTVIMALPRPKVLRRVIQTMTVMGIKKCYLIKTNRVEMQYWDTTFLVSDALQEQIVLGLEQTGDTIMPDFQIRKCFKYFIEDEVPALAQNARSFVAHPGPYAACPVDVASPTVIAIGPEGGFIDSEIDAFSKVGFQPITLGERILKVEQAFAVLLGRIIPCGV